MPTSTEEGCNLQASLENSKKIVIQKHKCGLPHHVTKDYLIHYGLLIVGNILDH